MNTKREKFLTRVGMLAVVASLVLPMSTFAQGNGRGRGKPTDVFVNGHDARDGRWDKNGQRDRDRNRDNDEWRRQRAAAEAQRQREIEEAQRQRDNDQWRRNQGNNEDWRRHNDDNDRNGQYDRNRRGRNWDRYGRFGGSFQLRQTALNAGYNNGIQEGRKDRRRGERFDYRDEGDYQKATEDYSSRLGDRELYRRYFREGFATGYEDGYRGY